MTDHLDNSAPIETHATPTAPQIQAAIRQLALGLAPVLALVGWERADDAINEIVAASGIIATVIAFAWGQYATRKTAKKAIALTAQVPDSVAKFK